MEINVIAGDITRIKTEAIIVSFFEGMVCPDGDLAVIDQALDGAISQLIGQGEIKGKLNEVTIVHSLGKLLAARVVVVGLGKKRSCLWIGFGWQRARLADFYSRGRLAMLPLLLWEPGSRG